MWNKEVLAWARAEPGDCSAPQEGCVYLNKKGNGKERRNSTSDSKEKRLFESGRYASENGNTTKIENKMMA